jgi:phenylpyruvate tautomerase PptA (4-oxalocrotonate tautomerase family)
MPLILIELSKGNDLNYLKQLQEYVLISIIETLKLPEDDRNIRVIEYDKEFFQMKKPYSILITISLFSGRTKETKALLYKTLVNRLFETMNIAKDVIFILLNEQPLENWGVRGGVPASDIKLDFSVNV